MNVRSVLLLILFVAGVVAWFRFVFYFIALWRRLSVGKGPIEGWLFGAGIQTLLDRRNMVLFSQFLVLLLISFLVYKYFPK